MIILQNIGMIIEIITLCVGIVGLIFLIKIIAETKYKLRRSFVIMAYAVALFLAGGFLDLINSTLISNDAYSKTISLITSIIRLTFIILITLTFFERGKLFDGLIKDKIRGGGR